MTTLLIVDDEPNLRRLLGMVLREEGHRVVEAASVAEARRALHDHDLDLVITDQRLGDGDGLAVLTASRAADPAVPVVFLTAYATVPLTVAAMRQGAFDVVAKPFDPDGVKAAVRRALEHAGVVRENVRLRAEVGRLGGDDDLIGSSAALERARDLAARVAPTPAIVLLTGETGTGKELLARAIHRASPRAARPFVPINCAAMPEGLLESELFGHERGAFTGAERARAGHFEAAEGGTLFLDEAGEMPASLQAKLLRVLADGMVTRVGSSTARRVDVRVVAATHRDLEALVRDGRFREDLYYRLAVFPIAIPPLRERPEDLPTLVDHFLRRVARDLARPQCRISPEALEHLRRYPFPGNVRELRNLVERACLLADTEVLGPEHFLLSSRVSGAAPGDVEVLAERMPLPLVLGEVLGTLEKALIARALRESDGVQAEAARRLGISRSDLHYKLRRAGTEP